MSPIITVSTALVSDTPAITVTIPVAATPLAPNKVWLKVWLNQKSKDKFVPTLTEGTPVAEQLIRVADRIGVLSSLASYKDAAMQIACYVNNLRIMTPAVIAGDITPESAVINAL